ncbi:MAG: CXXX repeat peptide maturase [Paludibacteraceae bacterium]|nr:CXXX repeat peptide maturase [Paludibacteraceae bacterium]
MKKYYQYIVILLDDTSVSYCHADNPLKEKRLIPLEVLREAILFSMKENLMIQFVYPEYELPKEYNDLIETIDHIKIGKDVLVYDSVPTNVERKNVVLRLAIADFLAKQYDIALLLPKVTRLNISITDIENFKDELIEDYRTALEMLNSVLLNIYKGGNSPEINILTDRLRLNEMHNCDAGVENITLAPNGKFYLCPAFYYDEQMGVSTRMNHKTKDASRSVGDLEVGINIPNKQLLELERAPLCRICDAYHCNRCIWLNQKLTWDNNTPSRQQCVMAHIERNASRDLSNKLKDTGFVLENEIKEINYLDPFDVKEEF